VTNGRVKDIAERKEKDDNFTNLLWIYFGNGKSLREKCVFKITIYT
jgi:hypothetical protein